MNDFDDAHFYGISGDTRRAAGLRAVSTSSAITSPSLENLYEWEGGMSFHCGFLGVILAMWLFAVARDSSLARHHRFHRAAGAARAGAAVSSISTTRIVGPPHRRARAMIFPTWTTCRVTRRSSTSRSKGSRCLPCCGVFVEPRPGALSRAVPDRYGTSGPRGIHPAARQLPGLQALAAFPWASAFYPHGYRRVVMLGSGPTAGRACRR